MAGMRARITSHACMQSLFQPCLGVICGLVRSSITSLSGSPDPAVSQAGVAWKQKVEDLLQTSADLNERDVREVFVLHIRYI